MRPSSRTMLLLALTVAACAKSPEDSDTGQQDTDTGIDDTDSGDSGDTDTAPVNTAPTATADATFTDEDTPTVVISVRANDTDAEGDALDVTAIDTTGMIGTATLETDDTVTWHPGAAFQTLGADGQSSTSFTYTVSDGALASVGTATITVAGVNDPPILTAPLNQVHDEGNQVVMPLVAADPDNATLTWSQTGLPAGLAIGPTTGRITGNLTATSSQPTPYTVTVTVSDGVASDDATFSWTVVEANVAPIFDPFDDQTHAEGDSVNVEVNAVDPEGVALVSYDDPDDTLPPGLSIGLVTGVISGTLDHDAAAGSPYAVVLRATDGVGTTDLAFTWTVTNTNRAPVVTSPGDQGDAEGDAITGVFVTASDDDAGTTLAWSSADLAAIGLAIDGATGEITGTIPYTAAGSHSVTVTVSDGEDTDDVAFTWNIDDTNQLPVATGPSDQTDAENDAVSIGVTASDPDGGTLSYADTSKTLPPGLVIDSASGVIAGTLTYDAAGTWDVVITVSDGTDSIQWPFSWTVAPTNRAPVFGDVSGRLDEEGATIASFTLSVTDPDGDDVDWSATGLPPGISINAETGEISGTVSYDAAGSTGTATWQVEVTAIDGADDTIASFDWDIDAVNRGPFVEDIGDQGDLEGTTKIIPVTAEDPDGDAIASWEATNLPPGLSIVAQADGSARIVGTIGYDAAAGSPWVFTLKATDEHGAAGEATYHYNVDDAAPPACEWKLADVTAQAKLPTSREGFAVAWLDYDRDPDPDVFVRGVGLFLGAGGEFTDVTETLQVDVGDGDHGVSVGDLNFDGDIDLLVPGDNLDGRGIPNRLYGTRKTVWEDVAPLLGVAQFEGTPGGSVFYDADRDNDLDLTFASSVGKAAHFQNDRSTPMTDITDLFDGDLMSSKGVAWADFDSDGHHDAFVTNGGLQGGDALFVRQIGNLEYWLDEARDRNVEGDPNDPDAGGATWVDLDADGLLDLHLVLVDRSDLVHLQDPNNPGLFIIPQKATDLGLGESNSRTSSAVWADYDQDGWLDALLPDVGIFHNDAGKGFTDVTGDLGYDPTGVLAGAWADYDGDLDVDLLVTGPAGTRLYENQRQGDADTCAPNGRRPIAAWTDSTGTASSREGAYAAIGARIELDLDGNGDFAGAPEGELSVWLVGQAMSGRAAVNHLYPLVGLGEGSGKVDVRVTFVDGDTVTVENVPTNKATLDVFDPGKGLATDK